MTSLPCTSTPTSPGWCGRRSSSSIEALSQRRQRFDLPVRRVGRHECSRPALASLPSSVVAGRARPALAHRHHSTSRNPPLLVLPSRDGYTPLPRPSRGRCSSRSSACGSSSRGSVPSSQGGTSAGHATGRALSSTVSLASATAARRPPRPRASCSVSVSRRPVRTSTIRTTCATDPRKGGQWVSTWGTSHRCRRGCWCRASARPAGRPVPAALSHQEGEARAQEAGEVRQ